MEFPRGEMGKSEKESVTNPSKKMIKGAFWEVEKPGMSGHRKGQVGRLQPLGRSHSSGPKPLGRGAGHAQRSSGSASVCHHIPASENNSRCFPFTQGLENNHSLLPLPTSDNTPSPSQIKCGKYLENFP